MHLCRGSTGVFETPIVPASAPGAIIYDTLSQISTTGCCQGSHCYRGNNLGHLMTSHNSSYPDDHRHSMWALDPLPMRTDEKHLSKAANEQPQVNVFSFHAVTVTFHLLPVMLRWFSSRSDKVKCFFDKPICNQNLKETEGIFLSVWKHSHKYS